MIDDVLEREDDIVEPTSNIDEEVQNIVDKLEDLAISAIEKSDEERIELINNADVSEINQEINQGTGLFRSDDPYGSEPLNTPDLINNPGIEIEEVIYKDRVRPELKGTVNVDNMINEEQYGAQYGEQAEEGISGDINEREEEVNYEEDNCLVGEDGEETCDCDVCDDDNDDSPLENDYDSDEEVEEKEEENVGKIADDINKATAHESEDEETVETPEELTGEEEVEEAVDTEGVDEEVEAVEEAEEVSEDATEETGEDVEEVADVDGEEVTAEESGDFGGETAEVEVEGIFTGSVNEELTGELREEVEAIELGDNSNTKMFDEVSNMKDVEFEVKTGSDLETAEAAAELVVDGVGVQETYTGEDIAETGSEETVEGTGDLIPGADEAEAEERLEEEAAAESLINYDASRKYSARNVISNLFNR